MTSTRRIIECCLLAAALAAPPALAQSSPSSAPSSAFSAAQLEQLVAPIALYPDSLVSQVLMASTYPLEIVEAARWSEKNAGVTGSALESALKDKSWDPSVKSLCGFADVLKRMNENLDWTQDLGDAFLGQKAELLDAVQRMRGKAYEAGNLKTTEQQVVTQQPDKIIVVQPAQPEVIYVPTYSPTVVYGAAWYYPSWYYPALYVAPRPGYGLVAFTAGVAWGAAVWGGCHWGWGSSDVDIDINRYNNFNKTTNINADRTNIGGSNGRASWSHDATHRKGVNYSSPAVAQKYGGSGASGRVSSQQARGWSGTQAGSARPSTGAVGAGQRPSTGAAGAMQRPSTGAAGATQRPSTGASAATQRPAAPPSRSTSATSGARSGNFDRSASTRGAASTGTASRAGGGARAGGGGRR